MTEAHRYDIFIAGETVDLIVPCAEIVENEDWHNWFNDPAITRFNNHGVFPRTKDEQLAYLDVINKPMGSVFALHIWAKSTSRIIGICSIQNIDYMHRTGEYATCMAVRGRSHSAIFHGLEAKALMTAHGFEKLGLERIYGGQVAGLEDWQKLIMLLGYRPEGYEHQAFRRGYQAQNVAKNACLLDEYLRLKEARNGKYWPGQRDMMKLIRILPKESIVERIRMAIDNEISDFMQSIPDLPAQDE